MIFKRETPFRQHVLEVAKSLGFHESHIESPVTSAGIPDLNLFHGVDIWLELKVWTPLYGVKMRPTQRLWHLKRHAAGGLSWVLVTWEGKLALVPGDIAAHLPAKDAAWTFGYTEGPISELPRLLRYMHREVRRRLAETAVT